MECQIRKGDSLICGKIEQACDILYGPSEKTCANCTPAWLEEKIKKLLHYKVKKGRLLIQRPIPTSELLIPKIDPKKTLDFYKCGEHLLPMKNRHLEIKRDVSMCLVLHEFNRVEYITDIYRGLQNPLWKEIIICLDGCVDGSRQFWEKIAISDERVILIYSHDIKELACYVQAIEHTSCDVVCIIQGDDVPPLEDEWVDNAKMLFDSMENLGVLGAAVGNNFVSVEANDDREGQVVRANVYARSAQTFGVPVNGVKFLPVSGVAVGPYFLDKAKYNEVGGFPKHNMGRWSMFHDYVLCFEMWKHGYVAGLYDSNWMKRMGAVVDAKGNKQALTLVLKAGEIDHNYIIEKYEKEIPTISKQVVSTWLELGHRDDCGVVPEGSVDKCFGCEYRREQCPHPNIFCVLHTRHTSIGDIKTCPMGRWEGEKKDELVSVIVLARNEQWLEHTLKNLIEMAMGPIEIIVVVDGPTDYELYEHELITYIRHDTPYGRRPSTNIAVQHAKGKYLFHVDAHVKTDTVGYDILFKEACVDNKTMVIPGLDKLILPEYRCKGRRMGHKYVSVKMKDTWSSIKCSQDVEQTITGNGMGWFLEKDYYDAMGGCDESYGKVWGNFGLEWAFKVWLSDPDGRGPGQVLLHNNVVFGHMWKKNVGYSTKGAGQGRGHLWDWVNNRGVNQVRDFSFFEEHLGHLIPTRHQDKQAIMVNNVTAIMNTNGMNPHLIEEAVESFLKQTYENKQLLIVCTHPKGLKLTQEYDNITIHNIEPPATFPEQIAYAIKAVQTRYWCVMDSDDIFFPDHIEQLFEGLKEAKAANTPSPFYVKVPKAWQERDGKVKERGVGWWTCLYEKMDDKDVDLALEKHRKKYSTPNSFDLVVRGLKMWSQYVMRDAEPTVLHRVGVSYHIGFSKNKPNRYQELLAEAAECPQPVVAPQWYEDHGAKVGRRVQLNVYAKNHLGDVICLEPGLRNLKMENPFADINIFSKFPELFANHPLISKSGHLHDCEHRTYEADIFKRTHLCTYLDQVTGCTTDKKNLWPTLYMNKEQEAEANKYNVNWDKGVIAFSIRTHAKSKRWDKGKWLEIVKWCESQGYQTLQLGREERRLHCTYDLVNQTNVIEAAAVLKRCKLFVCIDHGLAHIAAAVRTRSVVLFGPGMPIEAEHKGLTYPVETDVCRKCRFKRRMGRKCPDGNAVCMHSITTDMVRERMIKAITERTDYGNGRSIKKQVV